MRISIIILAILIVIIIVQYNSLITLKNNRDNAFADIDVQLKLRFDLLPNLIETVKWYANHEKETLENLTKARTSFMNAQSVDEKLEANNMLSWALKSLFAVSENYPDLKANQNFLQLQAELSDIENKIAAARRFFNSATKEFNTYLQTFPTNFIWGMFWFKTVQFFEADDDEKNAPEVKF